MHTWLRKTLLTATMTAALLLPAREADAALNSYLDLKGQKQTIKGDATAKGHEGWIEVLSFSHSIVSPRDSASGQATGKRQHKPFTVRMYYDVSLLGILIGMLEAGEKLEGTLAVKTKKKGKGAQEHYYTIELKDAFISKVEVESTTGGQDVIVVEVMPAVMEAKLADGTPLFKSTAPTSSSPNKKATSAK